MIRDHMDIVYALLFGIILSQVFNSGVTSLISPIMAKISLIPSRIIAPFVLLLVFFGATMAKTNIHDVGVALWPGANPKDILAANSEFLGKRGYKPELRLYAHAQGYDLVERPFFLKDETMAIQAGMNITVHPAAATNTLWCTVCDNYIIGPDGPGECLHKTPKEIIIVT